MIIETLKIWIAQSESWQTFIDFKLPKDSIVAYPFLKRPDDFYISLFGSLYEILENPAIETEKILSVAKGLEIYSLQGKGDNFNGVDRANNILFSAGLYYLADYSSSASILANIFYFENYTEDIEFFLLSFLNRKKLEGNEYRDLFDSFLKTGNQESFAELLKNIQEKKEHYFKYDPHLFSLYYLTERILLKFQKSNIWTDLLEQNNNKDFWKDYIQKSISKKFPIWDFFPSQKEALEQGLLGDYKSIALQTPTSSGKTAISELLIYDEIKNNPECKILYLAPFRALASELKQTFGKNLANLGISSKTIYGGDVPTLEERKAIKNVNLLISTPEKFMAIENIESNFSNQFSMVICDEGHLLGAKGNRGLSYELLLSRFKKEGDKKFVFLSAIVPNIKDINQWLGGDDQPVVESDYRATEIEYAFLEESKYSSSKNPKFTLNVNPLNEEKQYYLNKFLTKDDLSYKHISPKLKFTSTKLDTSGLSKSAIIALKSLNSGSVALFAPTKGPQGVNGLGKQLISQIDKKQALFKHLNPKENSQENSNLKEYFQIIFGEEYLLTKIVDYSILFHHGDLPQYVREVVEDYVREEKIKLIVCNTTLAEGVNLPIRTIVVHTTERFNPETERREKLNLRDLKNLFGRAGRAGKETKGLIIVSNKGDFEIVEKVIKNKELQEVEGYLYEIIKIIHKNIQDKSITLTNEILDRQNEEFKELTDVIDKAIIDLLEKTTTIENIEIEVQELIQQTFAFHQANDEERDTLKTLIQLRGDKIEQHFENNNFQLIKKSGSSIRLYEELENKLDIENDIWINLENSSSDEWLDFILEIVFGLSSIKYQLKRFNERNFKGTVKKSDIINNYSKYKVSLVEFFEDISISNLVLKSDLAEDVFKKFEVVFPEKLMKILRKAQHEKKRYLKIEDIKQAIKLWIQGRWFQEIAENVSSSDIDISLRLINQFIGYNLQSVISSIIHIVEMKLKKDGKEMSNTALDFPQYLQYGLQNRMELDLIEIGFTDRIGVLELSKILNNVEYSEQKEFRNYLNENNDQIFNSIKNKIPNIVLDKIKRTFSFLEYENIR